MKRIEKIKSLITTIIKIQIILWLLSCLVFTTSAKSETVTFEGKTPMDKTMKLLGILMKPGGEGPFPAVVLLHGCGGMFSGSEPNIYSTWASRLISWGYVTLQVHSFGLRSKTSICRNPFSVHPYERMYDAHAGKSYLESRSYVNEKRIAVMGWSHGGWSTLYAVDKQNLKEIRSDPFKVSIAFYPWCGDSLSQLSSPLLILIGGKDTWTPAAKCKNILLVKKKPYEINLKIYMEAYHGFDAKGVDKMVKGHQIKYDPVATKNSIIQVKGFLAKHLK